MYIMNRWSTCQVKFFPDSPQADIEFYIYMEFPQGIETKGGSNTTLFIKLLKNIYVQRQGYWGCNQHLTKSLEEIGFRHSRVEECVFYWREVIFIIYKDDGIFASQNNTAIDQAITEIGVNFDIEDQEPYTTTSEATFNHSWTGRSIFCNLTL